MHMRDLKKILTLFLPWKLLTLFFGIIALSIPLNTALRPYPVIFSQGLHPIVWSLANFDGSHYLEIALRGYMDLEYGFFPLLPIMIKALESVTAIPFLISGLIITNTAFFGALFVVRKLAILDGLKKHVVLFTFAILTFPTSFYYGAVYNDSIFLLLACLTIYYGRRGNWWPAGLFGALATLARLNGLALFWFLLVEYYVQSGKKLNLRVLLASSLVPLAFMGYLFFVQQKTGSFMNVFSSMQVWNQDKLVLPPQVVWRYIKIVFLHAEMSLSYWVAVAEFAAISWYTFILFFSWKKIRLSYSVFFALSLLIPSLTGTFQGMPRYGLHIYPFFLGSILFLKEKNIFIKLIYFTLCIVLMGIFTSLFTRGYFIS